MGNWSKSKEVFSLTLLNFVPQSAHDNSISVCSSILGHLALWYQKPIIIHEYYEIVIDFQADFQSLGHVMT